MSKAEMIFTTGGMALALRNESSQPDASSFLVRNESPRPVFPAAFFFAIQERLHGFEGVWIISQPYNEGSLPGFGTRGGGSEGLSLRRLSKWSVAV